MDHSAVRAQSSPQSRSASWKRSSSNTSTSMREREWRPRRSWTSQKLRWGATHVSNISVTTLNEQNLPIRSLDANCALVVSQVRTWFQNRRMKMKREVQDYLAPQVPVMFQPLPPVQYHSLAGERPRYPASGPLFYPLPVPQMLLQQQVPPHLLLHSRHFYWTFEIYRLLRLKHLITKKCNPEL